MDATKNDKNIQIWGANGKRNFAYENEGAHYVAGSLQDHLGGRVTPTNHQRNQQNQNQNISMTEQSEMNFEV